MGEILVPGGASVDLDMVTASANDVVAPCVFVNAEGEPVTGTLPNHGDWTPAELGAGSSVYIPWGRHNGGGRVTAKNLASQTPASATAAQVRKGYTAWVNGVQVTGTLEVKSAINFSAAAVSYNQIKISWQNPSIGPWEGVFIRMSTGGYPGYDGGAVVYGGPGITSLPGAWNEVIIGNLLANTIYYFTCVSYATGLDWSNTINVSATTTDSKWWIASNDYVTAEKVYGPFTIDQRYVLHFSIYNDGYGGNYQIRRWHLGFSTKPDPNSGFNIIDGFSVMKLWGDDTKTDTIKIPSAIGQTYYLILVPYSPMNRGILTVHYMYFDLA